MARRTAFRPSPPGDLARVGGRDVAGFSLLELLVTVAVAGVLMAGLAGVVGQTLAQWAYAGGRQELLR